jgi:Spy/CpxP family protein refolding chaperone
MKTNKLLTFAVVLLLIVNVVLLVFMFKGRGHDNRKGRDGNPFDKMVKELNMTDQQQAEFKKLKDQHFANISPVFDSVKSLKKSLFSLVKAENVNDSLFNHYTTLISEQRVIADKLTINHLRKVRALFSGDQQKEYDEFVQKMMDRRNSHGGKKKDSTGKGH